MLAGWFLSRTATAEEHHPKMRRLKAQVSMLMLGTKLG